MEKILPASYKMAHKIFLAQRKLLRCKIKDRNKQGRLRRHVLVGVALIETTTLRAE
jgi:hypothetical protein